MQCIDRYEGLTRDLIKRRPAVGFALTVPSAPFCTSTTAGGTGRVQPRLLCKKRDHPVTASSDTAAKPATSRWIFQRKRPLPLSTNLAEVVRVRTRPSWGSGVLTSRLCRRAVGVERPRARSLSPVGLVGGYVMAVHVSGRPADRSSERARGRSTPGGPPCLSPDWLCGDELERLRARPIGLSAGRLLAGSASYRYIDRWTERYMYVFIYICISIYIYI